MKRPSAILIGVVIALASAVTAAADGEARPDSEARRSGYSYVREISGDVTVLSSYSGRVDARRNLPISAGDEISVADGGRAEIALADGNTLFVGGGTRARFVSLRDQQGEEEDQVSAINLIEGSVVLSAGGDNEEQIPRIDTDDATIYLNAGAQVRVDTDSHRGTDVIGRDGSAEVRTRSGSFRLRAGEFLEARGDERPQIERGAFSRDRFDIWVADQIEMETTRQTRSASARRVDEQYANDVSALDGYGDWQYNDEYATDVWSPNVQSDWTPYSSGSWYYTPAGLTWWSYDPWGWFPFHYGTWFFSDSWNRWCWRPASIYSPAWVYWAYTPSFVGWCPLGSYSYWSPWYDNYYRHLGWYNRGNVYLPIHGVFSARHVDFRGWNFVGAGHLGTTFSRMDVITGSRIAGRLGSQVAVSSRPIVVNARPGQAREAVQGFVREAPRMIERTASTRDIASMAPILARQRTLSAATIDAVQQRAVVTDRGRLAGPGVADIAPRGALVERNRSLAEIAREPAARVERARPPSSASAGPERSAPAEGRSTARSETDWRSRPAPEVVVAPNDRGGGRGRTLRNEGWRGRPEIPPARRVIEGAVPGRRSVERSIAPPAREFRSQPRPEYHPRENRPPQSAPPRMDRAPVNSPPQPRMERAPVSSSRLPRAEVHHAPAPRPADRGRQNR